jgi:acyl carrier protein
VQNSLDETFEQTLENVLRMQLPGLADLDGPVPMDTPLSDLGLDSLRAVSLVLDLEDTFEIEFPDEMLLEATFRTGRALRQAITTLLEER